MQLKIAETLHARNFETYTFNMIKRFFSVVFRNTAPDGVLLILTSVTPLSNSVLTFFRIVC